MRLSADQGVRWWSNDHVPDFTTPLDDNLTYFVDSNGAIRAGGALFNLILCQLLDATSEINWMAIDSVAAPSQRQR